ncbi:hypothetical protein CDL12_26537 [Handroanthus impetiginosus]|uniref:Uncharacterized protein n=1 Tax=Handroanthus impetiginosus TaxID=429701 RepID=A0A2G9G6M7_9LAMI|nr:hypothetical protein CDL12_26537 [Handroanthus impetiginosus]
MRVTMLDEILDYMKFLSLQVKVAQEEVERGS